MFVRTLTGPASQSLVAIGFMVYSYPDYSHQIFLKKDIAKRINSSKNGIFLRARTVGANTDTSSVVTRALIIEAVAHKARAIKMACMENLVPTRQNRIYGNQVFVPFGNIEGFNNKNREKWIKRQT